jgi:hypothetical protein
MADFDFSGFSDPTVIDPNAVPAAPVAIQPSYDFGGFSSGSAPVQTMSNPVAPDGTPYKSYQEGWRHKLASGSQAVLEGAGPALDALTWLPRTVMGEFGGGKAPSDWMAEHGWTGNPNLNPDSSWSIPERRAYSATKGGMGGLAFGPAGAAGGALSEVTAEGARDAGMPVAAQIGLGMGAGGAVAGLGSAVSKASNINAPASGLMKSYLDAGITPRLAGDVSQSPGLQMLQNTLSRVPGAAGVINDARQATLGEFGASVNRNANQLGQNLSQQELGQNLQKGATDYIDRLRATNAANYENLNSYFPSNNNSVDLTNYQKALKELAPSIPGMPATSKTLSSDLHTQLASDLQKDLPVIGYNTIDPSGGLGIGVTKTPITGNYVSYDAIKGLRSKLGEQLAGANAYADPNTAGIKKLYGALTADMKAAAEARGTDAAAAMTKANTDAKNGHDILDSVVHPILNASEPEKAAALALSGVNNGGTKLQQIQAAMPDQFGNVQAYALRNLGVNRAGDFQHTTFNTGYNSLSPEARGLLFGGSPQLDALNNVAGAMKATGKYANTSNTAGQSHLMDLVMGSAMGGHGLSGIPHIAAALAPPYALSVPMTSPTLTRFAVAPNNFPVSGLLGGSAVGTYNGQ